MVVRSMLRAGCARRWRVGGLLAIALALSTGCGGRERAEDHAASSEGASPGEASASGASEARAAASEAYDPGIPVGVIEGVVRLLEGARLPRYATNPMISDRPAAELPPDCPAPSDADAEPVQVGSSGGLTNLVLVATGDSERWVARAPARTRTLRIERCRLAPRTLVAQRGDTLRLENELTFPFFPDLGTGFSQALLPSDPMEIALDQGGVRTVSCGFTNACGRAEIVTLYQPVFAVSDATGRFRLENVPADQDVRITAWHPLFDEVGIDARVGAGATAHVELVIRPAATAAAPSPPTPPAPSEGSGETLQ